VEGGKSAREFVCGATIEIRVRRASKRPPRPELSFTTLPRKLKKVKSHNLFQGEVQQGHLVATASSKLQKNRVDRVFRTGLKPHGPTSSEKDHRQKPGGTDCNVRRGMKGEEGGLKVNKDCPWRRTNRMGKTVKTISHHRLAEDIGGGRRAPYSS